MEHMGGIVWNMPEIDKEKPCSDCFITFLQAGLEDQAGNVVNTDVGQWLHHMVVMVTGPNRWDPTCKGNTTALPFFVTNTSPETTERVFSSGNERTAADVSVSNLHAGYYFRPDDKLTFIIDLMNTNPEPKLVYMTMTYEYVPGDTKNWDDLKPLWLDVNQCGVSDVAALPQNEFSLKAKPWVSNIEGQVLGLGTHLHDAGSHLEVIVNDRVICDSHAKYGTSSGFVSAAMGTMPADKHLSEMATCYQGPYELGYVKKGDIVGLEGFYNYTANPGMVDDDGNRSDIMAIGMVYIKVPFVR
jgi:hypothetical protein